MSQEHPSAKAVKQSALAEKGSSKATSRKYVPSPRRRKFNQWAIAILPLVWLAGALFLATRILIHTNRIRRIIHETPPSNDAMLLELLYNCQQEMGTRSMLRVIASDKIDSPALFGLIRPSLLLPSDLLANADHGTLRYILLHEIAHLKRHDILMTLIASALHVLHWFNPLIGYGVKRMHADRELACDEFVLSKLHPYEVRAYGRTIVNQLERLMQIRTCPLLAGFLGGRTRIRQRIAVISQFKREPHRWSPLMICLLLGLAWTGLTDGCVHNTPLATAVSPQATHLDEKKPQPYAPTAPLTKTYAQTIDVYMKNNETGLYLVTDGQAVTCDAENPGNAGLWQARFNGSLGHGGGVLLYSVSHDGYLNYDSNGNLTISHEPLTSGSHWIVMARPQGVWIISEDIDHYYLRTDKHTPVKAEPMGRDEFSYWDVIQLKRETDSHHDSN